MYVYFFIFFFFEVNSVCIIFGIFNRIIRCLYIGKFEKLDLKYKKLNDIVYLNFGIFLIFL